MATAPALRLWRLLVTCPLCRLALSPPSTPWPMYRRSPAHDAHAGVEGPLSNNTEWAFQADGSIYGSPVVGNGLVYFGTYMQKGGFLYAVNESTGQLSWRFRTDGSIGSTPALVVKEQLLLFGANDGRIYALDALSGALLWRYRHTILESYGLVSSVVHDSGHIYFGSSDHFGDVFALTATRKAHGLLWMKRTGSGNVGAGVPGSAALGSNMLYVGANDGAVHSLKLADGASAWSTQTMSIVYSSPALSPDLTRLFVGSNDGNLYALNCSSGATLWTVPTPGWVDSSPAIDGNGSVYVSTSNGNGPQNYANLYKVEAATGKIQWQVSLPESDGLYDPVVVGDLVCAGSIDQDGGAFSCWGAPSGQLLWSSRTGGHLAAAAAVGAGGELYVGDRLGKLFKFGGGKAHRFTTDALLV